MNIRIILKKDEVSIEITKNRKLIGNLSFRENHSLSDALLANLDKLLKKNKISQREIKKVYIKSEFPDSYTSTRIAKSLEKSFNFALEK